MKRINTYGLRNGAIGAALLLLFSACSKETLTPAPGHPAVPEGKGGVRIGLKLDKALASGMTKATVEDTYDVTPDMLTLSITGDTTLTWSKMTDVPEIIYLNEGSYRTEIRSSHQASVADDKPYYMGSSDFTVTDEQVTSVNVLCRMTNLVVSVRFAGNIAGLTGYKMSYFRPDDNTTILYSVTEAQNTPTPKRVYLTPAPYGVRIEGRLNGSRWNKNIIVYEDIAAGTYHNITIQ